MNHSDLILHKHLHEPRGAASAGRNSVYVSNGSGGGKFQPRFQEFWFYMDQGANSIQQSFPFDIEIIKASFCISFVSAPTTTSLSLTSQRGEKQFFDTLGGFFTIDTSIHSVGTVYEIPTTNEILPKGVYLSTIDSDFDLTYTLSVAYQEVI